MNESKDKPKQNPHGIIRKSAARLAAVQSLYCKYINGIEKDPEQLLADFIHIYSIASKNPREHDKYEELSLNEITPDLRYLKKVVRGVNGKEEELDALISEFLAENWEIDRIGVVLRALLHSAAYEIIYSQIPTRTIINEYIEVSRAFFEEKDVKFTNGILDSIAKKVRHSDSST